MRQPATPRPQQTRPKQTQPKQTRPKQDQVKQDRVKPKRRSKQPETIKLNVVSAAPHATVTQLAPRIAKENHRRRSATLKKIGIGLAAAVALGGATWVVAFSDYLALNPGRIQVNAEPDSLVDLAAVSALAGKPAGTPLLRVSTADLTEQITSLPAVKTAEVSRAWPTGLTINIESRVPAGAVIADAGYTWIDETGAVVGQFPEPGELVTLSGPVEEPRVLAEMLVVWQGLPTELQSQVRSFAATTTDDISTTLHSGQVLHWGSSEELMLKIATAQALLNRAPNSSLIDVSSPSLPITR